MIRRWSCVNEFNLFFKSHFFLIQKFDTLKLLKAVNYKKYTVFLTKSKRHRLSNWKRRTNFVIYTQILKSWIHDYGFNRKLVRSEFFNSILLFSFYFHNFFYIQKKNPLRNVQYFSFLGNSTPKCFYFYFYNKYKNKTPLLMLNTNLDNNVLFAYSLTPDELIFQNEIKSSPFLMQFENVFFSTQKNKFSWIRFFTSFSLICF